MKNHSLTQGSIAKGLLFFVIPLFFSNLFQQLYNTIDTLLVGHFLGDNALAAMGATAAIFELIVQFSNGCGTGFSIVTARYYGSKNENELKKSVAASLILGLIISIAITIVSYVSMPYLLTILKTPKSIYHDSLNYIRCISAFLIITMFYNLGAGMLRAIGDSLRPLIVLFCSSIINIALDQILMNRIGKKQIGEMSQADLKMCVIYQRMVANQSTGQENVVLEDVSDDDVAYLVEHKTDFPGFDVDFGGWKREYPYGESLSDVLGSVTTSTQGLPSELASYYLSKGYQYNASVGKSGLEYQYNDLLAGTPEIAKITYDSKGLAQKEVIQEAKKGYDIHLSIDIDLQSTLDNVLKNTLSENGGTKNRENFQSLFTTVLNSKDGSVLAMSGYQMDLDTKEMTYFASGNYMSLVNPGSCIKGATVYMGESEHVVSPGEVIVDKVMNIGGQEFGSYEDHGPVDDVSALQVSSNVYMFNVAIRLAGSSYVEKEPLAVADLQGTLNLMRSYYSMFGLGNKTGVDVPNESSSYMGYGSEPGMLLNYSIGQFDMYTPLQLATYSTTIASGGNLYEPHFMAYATEVNSSEVVVSKGKKIKSTLPEKNAQYLERVQQGFRACVSSGYCGDELKDIGVEVSAKTGTAEVDDYTTANLVGYAPSSSPTMSFACSAPTSSMNTKSVAPNICTTAVMPEVVKKYFELYPAS